jgi:ABC-2 type transport system ATP-binding protein
VINEVLNPFAGDAPAAPVGDPPATWVLLAAARREFSGATATLAPAGPITVNPTLTFDDGIIYGSTNAVDAKGLPLAYTVILNPSEGGKITFVPEAAAGTFSYLPYATVLSSGTEKFSMMVSETTAFETALGAVPLVGDLVQPIAMLVYQIPGLNTALEPLFGATIVVPFTAEPSALNPTGAPAAFTVKVISFDGTPISTNFFPASGLKSGDGANTILEGPGLGSAGTTDPLSTDGMLDIPGLVPGIAPLREAGYNVVTWDPRGEYASGGVLQLDSPEFEAKDVSKIIDFVLARPETKNHQHIGMVGGSYGGGIQLISAVTDKRIDAIVPGIAWNTLNSSLYPKDVFKTGWGSLLILDLLEAGATINPQIYEGVITGALLGFLTESQQKLLARSGTGTNVGKITAPTLLIQGTADGLFPLQEAVTNQELLTAAGTTVKMIWFCGGHGACLNPASPIQQKLILDNTLAWLDQYVNQDPTKPADDIPNFQWVDQNGEFFSSDLMPSDPLFQGAPISATGPGGVLPIVPIIGGSGPQLLTLGGSLGLLEDALVSFASAALAHNAIGVTAPVPTGTKVVGAPELTFTYSGLGTARTLYAQVVDDKTGLVLGNLATPIPVTLDGGTHTVTTELGTLNSIAYTAASPGSTLTIQLVSSATQYENLTAYGAIHVSDMKLSLPTVA